MLMSSMLVELWIRRRRVTSIHSRGRQRTSFMTIMMSSWEIVSTFRGLGRSRAWCSILTWRWVLLRGMKPAWLSLMMPWCLSIWSIATLEPATKQPPVSTSWCFRPHDQALHLHHANASASGPISLCPARGDVFVMSQTTTRR